MLRPGRDLTLGISLMVKLYHELDKDELDKVTNHTITHLIDLISRLIKSSLISTTFFFHLFRYQPRQIYTQNYNLHNNFTLIDYR